MNQLTSVRSGASGPRAGMARRRERGPRSAGLPPRPPSRSEAIIRLFAAAPGEHSVDNSAFDRTAPIATAGANGEPPARPVLTDVSPSSGPAEGGNEVTITGSGFANVQVLWGGEVVRVTSQSSYAISVVVPEGAAGSLTTVVVTNRDGTYASRPAAYSYR